MQSFQLSSHIDPQGVLKIQLPENLASQDVDIILVVEPKNRPVTSLITKNQEKIKENATSFGVFLKQFRQEIEAEQLDIDTSIFDRDRHTYTERDIEL